MDFGELLLRSHELWLHRTELLAHYQSRFQHILVDEFQDTNTVQYAWLQVLASNTDQRKMSKSLAFQIFNAKKATKDELYPDFLKLARRVLKQTDRGQRQVIEGGNGSADQKKWLDALAHHRDLIAQVIEQTDRRIIQDERVPSTDKIVSLFEPHTDLLPTEDNRGSVHFTDAL